MKGCGVLDPFSESGSARSCNALFTMEQTMDWPLTARAAAGAARQRVGGGRARHAAFLLMGSIRQAGGSRSGPAAAAGAGSASSRRNAVPNISHAVTKSAARMGPRMNPMAPKSRRPPSVEKKINSSWADCYWTVRPKVRISASACCASARFPSVIPRRTS